jgi:hypothetical protein
MGYMGTTKKKSKKGSPRSAGTIKKMPHLYAAIVERNGVPSAMGMPVAWLQTLLKDLDDDELVIIPLFPEEWMANDFITTRLRALFGAKVGKALLSLAPTKRKSI